MRPLNHVAVRHAFLVALTALGTLATPSFSEAQARWRLQEVARIGGGDEGLASFSDIRDFQLDDEGRVWVLDFQTQSLRLFAADGTPVREIARKGKGPGEITNTNGIRRAPDGRMIMRDHSNGRLAIFAADGRSAGHHLMQSFGYGYRWDAVVDAQGRLHEIATVRRGEEYERAVLRHAPGFATADTSEAPQTQACSDLPAPPPAIRGKEGFAGMPFEPGIIMNFAADGAYWCGNTDEYRIRRFAFGAKSHDRELALTLPRTPIPAAARDSAIKGVEAFLVKIGGAVEPWDKGAVRRDRGQLRWFESDDHNRMWVLRETPSKQSELDVWDTQGKRIAVIPVDMRGSTLFRIRGDRLALVTLDEDDLPTIVVYRISTR